jgi:hypothetical protein
VDTCYFARSLRASDASCAQAVHRGGSTEVCWNFLWTVERDRRTLVKRRQTPSMSRSAV